MSNRIQSREDTVIFLDIDGVLAIPGSGITWHGLVGISDEMVERLRQIVLDTGARIVLSSTWKLGFMGKSLTRDAVYLKDKLAEHGLEIDDIVRELSDERGIEIQKYLRRHPEITHFVIIDDDSFDIEPYFPQNFVHTATFKGLSPENVCEAIRILHK